MHTRVEHASGDGVNRAIWAILGESKDTIDAVAIDLIGALVVWNRPPLDHFQGIHYNCRSRICGVCGAENDDLENTIVAAQHWSEPPSRRRVLTWNRQMDCLTKWVGWLSLWNYTFQYCYLTIQRGAIGSSRVILAQCRKLKYLIGFHNNEIFLFPT